MPLITVRVEGVEAVRARYARLRAGLPTALARSIQRAGTEIAAALAEAAPKGRGGSSGGSGSAPSGLLAGDAPGPLAESFHAEIADASETRVVGVVRTTQPAKLRLVRRGRGPVTPREKHALMWEGLDHPVMRAGPVAANDFVTPVVERAGATVAAIIQEDLAAFFAES